MSKILFWLTSILLISESCTPLRITSDFQEDISMEEYHTFKVDYNRSVFPKEASTINHEQLEKIIILKMQELGFEQAENPDFYIKYFVKKEIKEGKVHKGEDPDDFDYEYFVEVFSYKEGSLVIDFVDSRNNKILWHGALTRTVEEIKRTSDKRMMRNVSAIFRKFAKDTGIEL